MILPIHIIIALASVIFTSYVFLSPTQKKLRATYGLIGLTLASGIALVVTSPAHIIQACVSGLVYVCLVTIATVAARLKLARMSA